MIVGVDPELQGRWIGYGLVKDGLARADQDQSAVLPRDQRVELAFYERLAFTTVETATLGLGGPPAWGMLRKRASELTARHPA